MIINICIKYQILARDKPSSSAMISNLSFKSLRIISRLPAGNNMHNIHIANPGGFVELFFAILHFFIN